MFGLLCCSALLVTARLNEVLQYPMDWHLGYKIQNCFGVRSEHLNVGPCQSMGYGTKRK